jgi:hypothetical protein
MIQRMHNCTNVDVNRKLGDCGFGWKMPAVLCSYRKPTSPFILLRPLQKREVSLLHNWCPVHAITWMAKALLSNPQ